MEPTENSVLLNAAARIIEAGHVVGKVFSVSSPGDSGEGCTTVLFTSGSTPKTAYLWITKSSVGMTGKVVLKQHVDVEEGWD